MLHEIKVGEQTIAIHYNECTWQTSPYVIKFADGEEWHFSTIAKAERAVVWHYQKGTLPQVAASVENHTELIEEECKKQGLGLLVSSDDQWEVYQGNELLGNLKMFENKWFAITLALNPQFFDTAKEAVRHLMQYQRSGTIFALLARCQQLEKIAYLDSLTGCFSRRKFEEYQTSVKSSAVLVVDIASFGEINKRMGHHVGDRILQEVAQSIKLNIRDSDCVFRWGGDEFVVIFSDISIDNAIAVGDRIKESVSIHLHIGVSSGLFQDALKKAFQSVEFSKINS